jgi:hypothetical protein
MTPAASGCATGCTGNAKNARADALDQLAAALLALSPADRAPLAAMLTGQGEAEGSKGRTA